MPLQETAQVSQVVQTEGPNKSPDLKISGAWSERLQAKMMPANDHEV